MNAEQPAGVGRNEERKNIEEVKGRAEEDSDTYRESQLALGADPEDVNTGDAYIFIRDDASTIMRQGKRKVRYLFLEGDLLPQEP